MDDLPHSMMAMLPGIALLFLIGVNAWTLLAFGHDKARARTGGRRVPEATLLGLALIGGTPAAFLARRLFRHKTRKQPFGLRLQLVAACQAGAILGLLLV